MRKGKKGKIVMKVRKKASKTFEPESPSEGFVSYKD